MKTRLLFLIIFVPVHTLLSLVVLRYGFNPPSGGHPGIVKLFSAVITSPVLLPLMMYDPDGEELPKWFRLVSIPLNSLVWGLALLLLGGLIECWRVSHPRG